MCNQIADVLQKRSDLSGFLVHLTRGDDPREKVRNMLTSHRIEARSGFGYHPQTLHNLGIRVACFTETPLEHLPLMTDQIEGRHHEFAPWGLAFPKHAARRLGANPVIYFHRGANGNGLAQSLRRLFRNVALDGDHGDAIRHVLAMVSVMRHEDLPITEWWWEREWRKVGDFGFAGADIAFGLCPRAHVQEMEAWAANQGIGPLRFLAPDWTMEEMITHLVGAPEERHPWPIARYGR